MTFVPTPRKPTGIAAAPVFLVSGVPKSGKSLLSYKIALSPRIHKTYVIDIGEGSADEYGGDEGDPPYEVLPWGRSWADLVDTNAWACAQKPPDGMLNAVIVDSGNDLWGSLSAWANARARNSKKAREELAKDPSADIETKMSQWNDAKGWWARVVNPLKLSGHTVGVVCARTELVSVVDARGNPTREKTYSYGIEKTFAGSVMTAHIAVDVDHSARLIEVRSKRVSVGRDGLMLGDNPLAEVLELLSPSGRFSAPDARRPVDDELEVDSFWADLVEHKDDEVGAAMRAFAAETGKPLKRAELLADPEWLTKARSRLDHLIETSDFATAHVDPYGDTP